MSRRAAFVRQGGSPEDRLVTGLTKLGLLLKHEERREADALGLSPTQAQILQFLRSRDPRPVRLEDLSRALGVGAATTSAALRALEAKGHVRRRRDPGDRRALAVRLTPQGYGIAQRSSRWPDVLLDTVQELSAEEKAVLLKAIVSTIASLQEKGLIPVARMCVTCRYFRSHAHDDARRPHHCAFADVAFADLELRVDCPDHEPVAAPG